MMINSFEAELNEIRVSIYEDIKDMTPEQVNDYFNKKTKAVMRELGLKMIDIRSPMEVIPSEKARYHLGRDSRDSQ